MERKVRTTMLAAGVVAAGIMATCLALGGCGSADAFSTAGAASQQPVAAKQDPAKPSDAEKSADSTKQDASKAADPAIKTYGRLGDFQATTLDGGSFTQEDIAAKDVTVLNIWSTTCGPCVTEMPDVAAFAKALPDNVQLVTFCFDGAYNGSRADKVLQQAGFEGTTLVSATDSLKELLDQVQYTPTTIFFAKDGTLVGEPLVGAPADLEKTYLEHVNQVLTWQGEKDITLEAAE